MHHRFRRCTLTVSVMHHPPIHADGHRREPSSTTPRASIRLTRRVPPIASSLSCLSYETVGSGQVRPFIYNQQHPCGPPSMDSEPISRRHRLPAATPAICAHIKSNLIHSCIKERERERVFRLAKLFLTRIVLCPSRTPGTAKFSMERRQARRFGCNRRVSCLLGPPFLGMGGLLSSQTLSHHLRRHPPCSPTLLPNRPIVLTCSRLRAIIYISSSSWAPRVGRKAMCT
ncbi:hypothetical protein C8Q74DRAFT_1251880 [Fomes fomentarius]|nr:hypothetical protein C8Q74DRAFT_1251880 [Fomes fomentarius]